MRKIHFVTGKLAANSLRETVERVATQVGFDYSVDVLPITVAALMTPDWIARHMQAIGDATEVLIPGYCAGDLSLLQLRAGVPVARGPCDLRALPEYFDPNAVPTADHQAFDIEILAEINHVPRLPLRQVLETAKQMSADGADLIDVGCEPGDPWLGVGECVAALREIGLRVSIDSFHPQEIDQAVAAGAELALSVNQANIARAVDWGCAVVVIPDDPASLAGLDASVEFLQRSNVPLRIDPVLDPIGCGFARSLGRYLEVRRRYPQAELLMGVGNLTELTDCDSAGINVLLLGFCQEVGIRSVLTTQVINWARTSVRECDLARRLVHYAVRHGVPPKNVDPRLVMLRDCRLYPHTAEDLDRLADEIKDENYRLFLDDDAIHVVSRKLHLVARDPFELFERLATERPHTVDPSHAFYLGFELAKAVTALTLGKEYRQDEALEWGMLTVAEKYHRLK
jgi:dihydropteroate synthase-like protein